MTVALLGMPGVSDTTGHVFVRSQGTQPRPSPQASHCLGPLPATQKEAGSKAYLAQSRSASTDERSLYSKAVANGNRLSLPPMPENDWP